jgi:hypothetical protein
MLYFISVTSYKYYLTPNRRYIVLRVGNRLNMGAKTNSLLIKNYNVEIGA